MRVITGCACSLVLSLALPISFLAQAERLGRRPGRHAAQVAAGPPAKQARADRTRPESCGRWRVVPGPARSTGRSANGQVLNNSKLSQEATALHVETGPSTTYWNPANRATGNYTVKATFTEPKYMSANSHPHPYGIMIGGNDLGTQQQSYLYCSAYGNGNFIVRGFGPSDDPAKDTVFAMNGGRGAANDAVHKAAGPGQPVTQDIAVTVKADSVECAINGTVVATYPKSDIVTAGKLKSTDGVYGIRFSHNTDASVTGLTLVK